MTRLQNVTGFAMALGAAREDELALARTPGEAHRTLGFAESCSIRVA